MATQFCLVESGCLKRLDEYLTQYGLRGYTVAVYDENTYAATADRHPQVDAEVILPARDLHANEHGVDRLLERLPEKAEVLLAIGSGTVHDICRYCAYERGLDFVSCPTAASVDGFCSSVAAMTWHGCKKTLTAVAPKIVVADLDIIKKAPIRLARSGFGDMVGKYIALTDWRLGHLLSGEYYCDRIAQMTLEATRAVLDSLDGILAGEESAYEKLTGGLLLSGLAMQLIGNSRPASGAEHHISHIIEMQPAGLGVSSDALHGEKVGVGTLLVLRAYRALAACTSPSFADYIPYPVEVMEEVFGREMTGEIVAENQKDAAAGITADTLRARFADMVAVLHELPDPDTLEAMYTRAGIKASLADIDVPAHLDRQLLACAPMVRNRLTLLRLLSRKAVSI